MSGLIDYCYSNKYAYMKWTYICVYNVYKYAVFTFGISKQSTDSVFTEILVFVV